VDQDEYGRMYAAEERQWWYAGMRAITDALLREPLRSLRTVGRPLLVDAGCGTGQNLRHFGGWARVQGFDLSAEAVRLCRARGVDAARASVLALPVRGACVDVVTSFDVIYHGWVPSDLAALNELVRTLRPGGLLLVRVPAFMLLWGAHDEAVHSRHRYTAPELRALFARAGLERVRVTYCNSILFPLLALRRTLDRWLRRHGSDVEFLPAPLEWLFLRFLRLEAWLIGLGLRLPVGASVMALGRKREVGVADRAIAAEPRAVTIRARC
jgi:SAM-dependent methyltransferase